MLGVKNIQNVHYLCMLIDAIGAKKAISLIGIRSANCMLYSTAKNTSEAKD